MKFKLDENFGTRTQKIFIDSGHDVQTVYQQGLRGVSDEQLYGICQLEQRCLVTLDLDFANVLRFSPDGSAGIVVIRLPENQRLPVLENLVRYFLRVVEQMPAAGQLWIVEVGRVRVHQSGEE
ncbi:MAG: DUF5615 family PIN-like protein [Anaerolineales bacterium]|nr:DUF5615 family PIN-like protein [Anaerolineales bacterium]